MPHNQQAVEQTKRDCRYDEQIHRGDAVGMIAKERPPALGWRVSSLGHVLGHAGLSDIDAELEEFSMDPRRSPQRIGNAHLADKLAYLRRYSWSAATAPRLPPPVRSEPGAVPFNHGLRLHDRQAPSTFGAKGYKPANIRRSSIPKVGRFGDCRRNAKSCFQPQARPATGTLRPTPTKLGCRPLA